MGKCSAENCDCVKYRPNFWKNDKCKTCQHAFSAHENVGMGDVSPTLQPKKKKEKKEKSSKSKVKTANVISGPSAVKHEGHFGLSEKGFEARNLPPQLAEVFSELNTMLKTLGYKGLTKKEAQFILKAFCQQLPGLAPPGSTQNAAQPKQPTSSPSIEVKPPPEITPSQPEAEKQPTAGQTFSPASLPPASRSKITSFQREKSVVIGSQSIEAQTIEHLKKTLADLTQVNEARKKEYLTKAKEKDLEVAEIKKELETEREAFQKVKEENEHLKELLREERKERERLETVVANLEVLNQELKMSATREGAELVQEEKDSRFDEELAKLKEKMESRIKIVEEKLQNQLQEKNALEVQLNTMKSELQQTKESVKKAEEAKKDAKQELETLHEELQEAKLKLAAGERECNELKQHLEEMQQYEEVHAKPIPERDATPPDSGVESENEAQSAPTSLPPLIPAPPPPPPPPVAHSSSASPMVILRSKSETPKASLPVVDDSRSNLLASIRSGIQLRSVSEDQKNQKPAFDESSVLGLLAKAIIDRRAAIKEKEEEEEDEMWE